MHFAGYPASRSITLLKRQVDLGEKTLGGSQFAMAGILMLMGPGELQHAVDMGSTRVSGTQKRPIGCFTSKKMSNHTSSPLLKNRPTDERYVYSLITIYKR